MSVGSLNQNLKEYLSGLNVIGDSIGHLNSVTELEM